MSNTYYTVEEIRKRGKNKYVTVEEMRKQRAEEQKKQQYYKVEELRAESQKQNTPPLPSQNNSFFGNVARQIYGSASDEVTAQNNAYRRMNLPDHPSYTDVSNEMNRLQNIRGGAARRGRGTDVYDKALSMLKGYADKSYSFGNITSAQDRLKLYEDKKRELEQKKNDLNSRLPANASREEQVAYWLPRQEEKASAEKAIRDLEQEIKIYERDYAGDFYNHYKSDPQFEKLSQKQKLRDKEYDPQNLFEDLSNPFTGYSPKEDEEDKLGAYLEAIGNEPNGLKNVSDDLRHSWLPGFYTDEIIYEGDKNYWKLINDDEKAMYYYLYNKEGKETAYEYLDKLSSILGRRNKGEMETQAANASPIDLALMNLDTIPAKLGGSLTSVAEDATNLLTGKGIDPYSKSHELSNFSDAVRGETAKKIENATGGANIGGFTFGDAYQSVMSAGDMVAASALFGGNSAAVGFAMSMDAARAKAQELYDKGATNEQIIAESLAAGAFEAIFETLSLDLITDKIVKGMLTKKTAPRFIAAALMAAGVEGSEEVFTDIANYVTDIIIMRDKSERQQLIKDYVKAGYSKSEAEQKATDEFKQNLWKSFMGGAVAGGLFGGSAYASPAINAAVINSNQRKSDRNTGALIYDANNVPSLVKQANAIDANTEGAADIQKQAAKVQKLYEKQTAKNEKSGGDTSSGKLNKEAGTLYNMLRERDYSEIDSASSTLQTTVRDKVIAATGTENAVAESAIIKSEITGDQLTEEEQAAINTPEIQTAIQELRESGELNNAVASVNNALSNYAKTTNLRTERTDEDLFTSNDDGKTYIKGQNTPITIQKVTAVSNDDMDIELTDGSIVKASNIDFGDPGVKTILSNMIDIQNDQSRGAKMSAEYVNTAVQAWQQGNYGESNIQAFAHDMREIYYAANTNDKYSPKLVSQGVADMLYSAATNSKKSNISAKSAKIQQNKTGTRRDGTVVFEDAISEKALNPLQKVGVETVRQLAKSTGITFHFFKSTKNNGVWQSKYSTVDKKTGKTYNSPNGFYKDGEIWVDINSGNNGEGLILFTVSHELVHFMNDFAPEQFDTFAKYLFDNYANENLTIKQAVHREMARNTNLKYDEAYEEVVARLSEAFLRDAHLTDKSRELYNTDKSVWEKVRDGLKDIVDRIKKYFAKLSPESDLGKIGAKMVKENQAILDRFLAGVRAASENAAYSEGTTSDDIVRMMARESEYEHKKITLGMSDSERYEILKSRTLNNIPAVTEESIKKASINSWDDINSVLGKQKRKLIHKLASEFGVFKGYENSDIDLQFIFTHNDFRESFGKQKKNFVDFAKMFSVFDDVVTNAVGIEVHNRNEEGYKTDPTLEAIYVLISAFRDGENIVPVKLSIKEFKDKANGLYVAIALEKVKATEVSKQGNTGNGVTQSSRSIADISIAQLFRKINPNDEEFIKYIPDGFLDGLQLEAKERALKKQSDSVYLSAVNHGDMETAQRMVDEAAERAFADSKIRTKDGKLRKVYHGTYSDTFTVFDKKLIGTARGGDVGFFGKGFYFAFTEGEAGMYGKNLIDAYLDIKNPFDFQKKLYTYQGERSDVFHGGAAAFIVNFSDLFPELSDNHYVSVAKAGSDDIIKLSLKKFADEFKKYYNGVTFNVQKINSDYGDVWLVTAGKKKVEYTDYKGNKRSFIDYDFQQKFYDEKSAKNRINQVYSYLEKVVYDYIDLPVPRDIIQETEFSNALKNRGYDGVIQSEDGDEIVAFESSQIKSADPVTYDDNGEVIPLSERFNSEKEDIRYQERGDQTYTQEEVDEYIRKEREKADKRIKELMDKYKKQRHENVEKRNKTKVRHSVMKKSRELNKLLNRSAKEKTVKQGLRESTENLLKVSNMLFPESLTVDEMAAEGVGDATAQEQKALDRYKKLLKNRANKDITQQVRDNINAQLKYLRNNDLKDLITRERERYDEASREANSLYMKEALTELSDAYKKIKDAKEAYIRDSYDEEFVDMVDAFKEEVGDKLAKDLTLNELLDFNKIVTMMTHSIRNANKMFVAGRKATLAETGDSVMNEILKLRTTKEAKVKAVQDLAKFGVDNFKPVYAARYLGSDTFVERFWNLQKGELDFAVDIEEAKNFKEDCEKKWNYKDFKMKKTIEYEDRNGRKFSLNLNQRMALYAMSRRPQGLQHLTGLGFSFESGSKANAVKTYTSATAHPLSVETINKIADSLSANEKGYAEDMQKYLSEVMADKGNQVSLAMYGVRIFNEDIYWRLSSDKNYTPKEEKENKGQYKAKNAGFTHAINRKANNPVELVGFEEAWIDHVYEMSTYHSMVLPLEDITRVFNYRSSVNDESKSVKSTIQGTFSEAMKNYFDTLIADLNGGMVRMDSVAGVDKMISLSKKDAVLANLSVVVQQPSAIFRAMAYVNPKYFAYGGAIVGTAKAAKSLISHVPFIHVESEWENLKKYAPVAIIKEMGGFDTSTGRGVMDYLKSGKNDSLLKRGSEKIDNALGKAPEFADRFAWIQLWNAIQRETKAKYGYKVGTEENKIKSGKRFCEVVHLTQVYDSTLSRSGSMRHKDAMSKMLTAYMAEPLTYANMMMDAVVQTKRAKGIGNKIAQFGKVTGAVAGAILANSLLHAIVVAMRDDDDKDDDGTYGDKYLKALLDDIIDGVNPLNYLPITRDVWSLIDAKIKGYRGSKIERTDMSLITKAINVTYDVGEKAIKGELTGDDILDEIGVGASFVGVPVTNIVRDVRSSVNLVQVIRGDRRTAKSKDEISVTVMQKYQETYDTAYSNGYSEEDCKKKAEQSARSAMKKDIKPLYLEAIADKDYDKANDLRSFMHRSGLYKDKNGNSSLSVVDERLKKWREEEQEANNRKEVAEGRKE